MIENLYPVRKNEVPEGVELETINYNVAGSEPQMLVKRGICGEPFYMDKKQFYKEVNTGK